jgi:GTP cyclohydrolase I
LAQGAFDWYKVVVKNIASGYSTFASTEWPEPDGIFKESLRGSQSKGGVTEQWVSSTS